MKKQKQCHSQDGAYYNGVFYPNKTRYTPEQQWEILNTHPFFTGVCPQCKYKFNDAKKSPQEPWDCPQCGYSYQHKNN